MSLILHSVATISPTHVVMTPPPNRIMCAWLSSLLLNAGISHTHICTHTFIVRCGCCQCSCWRLNCHKILDFSLHTQKDSFVEVCLQFEHPPFVVFPSHKKLLRVFLFFLLIYWWHTPASFFLFFFLTLKQSSIKMFLVSLLHLILLL